MKVANVNESRERLKEVIRSKAYVRATEERIVSSSGKLRTSGWLMDIRRIILDPAVLSDIAVIFESGFKNYQPYQIGGLETASIPLVTSLVVSLYQRGRVDISGFFIRKSRKKDGLMRIVEGEVTTGVPIILVDDLMNSGRSFIRQVEILEELGHNVKTVWSLIRFRDVEYYEYFTSKGIEIRSIFTLNDFESLGLKNLPTNKAPKDQLPYKTIWKFAAQQPSYQYVVAKSDPAIDDKRVYFGSDDGVMWALNQRDGADCWSYKIGFHKKGKGIFSSPCVSRGTVYFGGYDGNFYALDAETGKRKWVALEADWIGSSPAIAEELGLVFVGLEFGLWRKHGGIAAFDMLTGKTIWVYRDMPGFTHSSPLFIREHNQVIVGNNDGSAYLFNAKNGELVWKYASGSPTDNELSSGFSEHDIKESFAYDARRDLVVFGNKRGKLVSIDRNTGRAIHIFEAEFGFFSTPLIHDNRVYASSLDKRLYCLDLDTFGLVWEWNSGARIFASPVLISGSLFIGSNAGRVVELDPRTGAEQSSVTLPERITNRIGYNDATKRFFVSTFANEVYCIEKGAR